VNDNTILISSYLQQEMDEREQQEFESRLANDPDLRKELEIQKAVVQAVSNQGIKRAFAQAIQQNGRRSKWKMLMAIAAIVLLVLVCYLFRDTIFKTKKITTTGATKKARFINPPLPEADLPFTTYKLDAAAGDTLIHSSGSILYFPPSAFVDASGNTIKGEVQLKYREFKKPVDFFVSGIPMRYDSAGTNYIFESAGMFEITAYQNDEAVYVNAAAKPEILMSSDNSDPLQNVYYLDTVAGKWNFIGKDVINVKSEASPSKVPQKIILPAREKTDIVKPVMPAKADEEKQAFSIAIDPGSFEELFAYDNLKFQVVNEKGYNRADADEHWETVSLDHTATDGIYLIKFSNDKRSVQYTVQPVLEGRDYDEALVKFKKQQQQYQTALQARRDNEQRFNDSLEMVRRKKEAETRAAIAEAQQKFNEMIRWRDSVLAAQMNPAPEVAIFRSFSINGFGIWNCDRPQYPNLEIPITGTFNDEMGNPLNLAYVAVVYKDLNGLTQFPSPAIRVIPGYNQTLWSLFNNKFYYYSYADFAGSGITRNSNAFEFRMRVVEKEVRTYEDIKAITEAINETE
jgi:hypothetical protein